MAYISGDGRVLQTNPWGFNKILGFFLGIFQMFYMFFRTLFNPGMNRHGSDYTRDYRPGSGPPRPPTRRMGRPNTGSSINAAGATGGCPCAR